MRALLAHRNIRVFYLANAVSTLGDYSLYVALGVWVKILTGSTGEAGITFLMLILGSVTAPLSGILVDRVRRKRLLVATYLITAVLLMTLLLVHSGGQVWIIFAVTFCYGVSGSLSAGAQQAMVRQVVPAELLADANGLQQTATQGMRLITPLIGVGLLTWLGGHAVAVMDALTFLIAVSLMHWVDIDEAPREEPASPTDSAAPAERRHRRADITTGFRYVLRTPALRQMCVALAVMIFFVGFYETLSLQIVTVGLHHPPSWLGVMISVQGIGGLIGGVTAGPAARRIGDGMLTACGLGLLVVFSLLAAIPDSAAVLAGAVCCGISLPWVIVGGMTVTQKSTPNELMGRVGGAVQLSIQAPQSIGIAIGAAVVDTVYYRGLCLMVAAGVALAALFLATRREQRKQFAATPAPEHVPDPAAPCPVIATRAVETSGAASRLEI